MADKELIERLNKLTDKKTDQDLVTNSNKNLVASLNKSAVVNSANKNLVATLNKSAVVNNVNSANKNSLVNNASSANKSVVMASVNKNPVVANTNKLASVNKDSNDILEKISDHLKRWGNLDKRELYPAGEVGVDTLHIGNCNNCSITVECMLHYLSTDPSFLADKKNDCGDTIKQFSTKNKDKSVLHLDQLLKLSSNQEFISDTNFYYNLYNFDISMVKYLYKDNGKVIKTLDPRVRKNLLSNLYQFIKQSLIYLTSYMDMYKVVDPKLLQSSYNLLYLMNHMAIHHVNSKITSTDLEKAYKQMLDSVQENIAIFKQIKQDEFKFQNIASVPTGSTADNQSLEETNRLISKLVERTKLLHVQKEELKKNVSLINKNQANLAALVNNDTKFKSVIDMMH